jgi:CDP-glycerol:poly(glycerophosphate) glycerophosphotransferase
VGIKDKLRAAAVVVVLNGLAVLAFVALALTSWRGVGYALAAVTLVGVTWRALTSGFGPAVVAELLLTAGLLADYRVDDFPLVGTGILLTLLIVNQPALELVVDRPEIQAANLPGYRAEADLLIPPTILYAATPVWIALLGVSAAARWSAWPIAIGVTVGAIGAIVVGVQALRIRLRGPWTSQRLRNALEHYDPAFALHFSAPDHTEYHVDMWRPYLERIGRPWIIVVREPQPFATCSKAAAAAGIPVLYCPLIEHVDEVVTTGLRAVFYVNNGMKNTHMVRFNRLTHIQLLHGDSDKASSFNPVTAMFDRIFVAGQAGIDRYAANGVLIPREKFDIVGRPQVETITVTHDRIRDLTDKVVLYATTWVSHYDDANYSSLRIGEQIITKLLERKATVILRPHPYTDRDPTSARQIARLQQILADDRSTTGRAHVFGAAASTSLTVFDCANRVDAMISDVSGIASDFLYSGKPFAMTNMLGDQAADFEASFPLARAAYVIDKDGSNLDDVLDNLLTHDPLEQIRRDVKIYYLGDFDEETYADGFITAARRYL